MTRIASASAAIAISTAAAFAQSPAQPNFEVASVKANLSGQPMQLGPTLQASGRIYSVNVPLRRLVQAAYGVDDNQVVGGPDWLESARFDVEARAGANTTPEQARAILRTLLAERFALTTHGETRQLPIFEMTLASRDGRPGPQLKPSGPECSPPTPGQPAPSFANAPELPTAVREQLGLRLESTRGPVDVIVIDRAERPTEN